MQDMAGRRKCHHITGSFLTPLLLWAQGGRRHTMVGGGGVKPRQDAFWLSVAKQPITPIFRQQLWQSVVRTAHPAPCGVCCTGWGWWATGCTFSLCLMVDTSLRLVRLWLERLYVVFSPCWWLCHSMVVGFPEWEYRKGDKRGFPISNIASEATPRHVHCDQVLGRESHRRARNPAEKNWILCWRTY